MFYAIRERESSDRPKFVWRKTEWSANFISPWAMFERFRYANYALPRDILHLFGKENSVKFPLRTSSRDLIELQGFEAAKLTSILGEAILDNARMLIEKFIRPLNGINIHPLYNKKPSYDYVRKDLSFCSDCLKLGYHSVLHQFSLFEKCPYHNTTLLRRCPGCRKEIPYYIPLPNLVSPFTCCYCGYDLTSGHSSTIRDFIDSWIQSKDLEFTYPEIMKWINYSKEKREYVSKIIIPKQSLISSGDSTIKQIVKFVESNHKDSFSTVYSTLHTKNLRLIVPETDLTYKVNYMTRYWNVEVGKNEDRIAKVINFDQYVNIYVYQSYKAILRHIRKKYLKKHRKCLNRYYNKSYEYKYMENYSEINEVCLLAVAYSKLRHNMEKIVSPYWLNHLPQKWYFELPIDWQIIRNIMRRKEINQIISDYYNLEKLSQEKARWPTMVWIINHVVGLQILKMYNQWVKIVFESKNSNKSLDDLFKPEYPMIFIDTIDDKKLRLTWHQLPSYEKNVQEHIYPPDINMKRFVSNGSSFVS